MPQTTPTWAPSVAPAQLLVDGAPSGVPLWVAHNRKERNAGLLGTEGLDGALWIRCCNWVHTFGMRYAIDVVYLSRSGRVRTARTMRPGRLGAPRVSATAVVELPAGAAAHAGITPGRTLAVGPADERPTA
ncbi:MULTISPECIES: DUF192 domain-containing protein [unclassified Actinomyces]|nr:MULTISPECIES: DUF192 domain-containing protein [unclassified Actinomyces]MCL3777062.1 DUF192 domain-containing protein [Actinomyces sp. AC-20-1]MCL3790282.1 DUF192 domain-containing protein [Actinomyces sp. 187325]MCL3793786.1 DUF192 domain-containing protein [Actinomyces sp. 217892]